MPSRTSKPLRKAPLPWKAALGCSEQELSRAAEELARELAPRARVLLQGEMGAGKSTFARALLKALGIHQPAEGSPTFALVHEYDSPRGRVAHLDVYRLSRESELESSGIQALYWERDALVISEWLSMFPEFERSVIAGGDSWVVRLTFSELAPDRRDVEITRLSR